MGKIYSMNNQEIGCYENGTVKDTRGNVLAYYNESNGEIYQLSSVANNYFAAYEFGKIYRKNGFAQSEVGKIVSGHDWGGYDGKILDSSGNTVAFYRGEDCIGLGAAAATLVFRLHKSNSSTNNGNFLSLILKLLTSLISLIWFLFPLIPVIVFISIGLFPFACIDIVMVIIGTILCIKNKKNPSMAKTVISELLLNLAWFIVPVLFGFVLMWAIGFIIAFYRLVCAIIKQKKRILK